MSRFCTSFIQFPVPNLSQWFCHHYRTNQGSMIQSRKVAVTFAKPQNQEQALESNLNAKAEQDIGRPFIWHDVVRYAHEVLVKQ